MMKALLVVLIALLLLVGSIAAVLMFSGSTGPSSASNGSGGGGNGTAGNGNGGSGNGGPGQLDHTASLGDPVAGRQVTMRPEINCIFCHSDDGSTMIGPSFKGLYGSTLKYDDGSTIVVDASVVRFALKHPIDKIVDGFEPRMPELDSKMNETDKVNLIAYLKSIGKGK